MLNTLQNNENIVFPKVAKNTRTNSFRNRMKNLARQHNNPRFLKIYVHTFRHCKALREYHRTRLLTHVKKIMGHRSVLTTMRYVEVYEQIYGVSTKGISNSNCFNKQERIEFINDGGIWFKQMERNGISANRNRLCNIGVNLRNVDLIKVYSIVLLFVNCFWLPKIMIFF
ncbi:MAG: tyrosine-type recombinase/integrase [Candidatus Bathyarchaeota archaeon]|nr:MAG: tyrosine-type recombinase/integrase [Candidatus Bathyarchaeota archaeon]